MKEIFISYTEAGNDVDAQDDFRIVGDDYKEVLERLCLFLNDQSNFPYRLGFKPMTNGEEIR
tara:strand:- start:117 stop:302 length:186 start_codon:yes stop_codon:yes gene_type:complete